MACAQSVTLPKASPLFPWFGSKKDVAAEIWDRFGDVPNFVDPCCGSCAVPLLRPHPARTMTLNDSDGFLVNFLRAVEVDPESVAHAADWPVSELDLTARHAYLVKRIPWLVERLEGDPGFYDPRLAGWWLWGLCAWLGRGWCGEGATWKQIPDLGSTGRGVHRPAADRLQAIRATLTAAQGKIRGARIACGDWRRVLTPGITWSVNGHGNVVTGVLLDPPYRTGSMSYAGGGGIAEEVGVWARENGEKPLLRIALCGHEGDHDLPGWSIFRWRASGGYGNAGGDDAEDNRHRECIWFSPHCLGAKQPSLFT